MTASSDSVVQTIDAMLGYFRGGERWITDVYETRDGKCLVGAVQAVRASSGNASWVPAEAIAAAKYYIERAVRERGGRGGPKAIEHFNDSRLSFAEIAGLLIARPSTGGGRIAPGSSGGATAARTNAPLSASARLQARSRSREAGGETL